MHGIYFDIEMKVIVSKVKDKHAKNNQTQTYRSMSKSLSQKQYLKTDKLSREMRTGATEEYATPV